MNENEISFEESEEVLSDIYESYSNDSSLVDSEEVQGIEGDSSNFSNDLLLDIITILREEGEEEVEEDEVEEVVEDEVEQVDYSQYIYDYLTDTDVNVYVTNTDVFLHKPISQYTTSEGLLLVIALILFFKFFTEFVKNNVFKLK